MFVQEFLFHLSDGTVIPAMEPMDLEGPQSILDRFGKGDPKEIFCIGDSISGYVMVPTRSIVYISTGDVKEVEDWPFRLKEMISRNKKSNGRRKSGYEQN